MDEDAIFAAALQKAPDRRSAYLDDACAGDPQLRANVESLLNAHEEAGGFLEPDVVARATIDHQPIQERPGSTIGVYKILEQIGEGGFGNVYMAEQQETIVRKVALKIIKPGRGVSPP